MAWCSSVVLRNREYFALRLISENSTNALRSAYYEIIPRVAWPLRELRKAPETRAIFRNALLLASLHHMPCSVTSSGHAP